MNDLIRALRILFRKAPRRSYCLYVKDKRRAVETMVFAEASSEAQIRNLALSKLRESVCHQTVTVWEGLNPLFVVGPGSTKPIALHLSGEENRMDRWDQIGDNGLSPPPSWAGAHRGEGHGARFQKAP
jgi:hypothetical protein